MKGCGAECLHPITSKNTGATFRYLTKWVVDLPDGEDHNQWGAG